jgi:hypothetical protein
MNMNLGQLHTYKSLSPVLKTQTTPDCMTFLILHWGGIFEPGVRAMRIVPGFDKLEDGHSGFRLGLEPTPVE